MKYSLVIIIFLLAACNHKAASGLPKQEAQASPAVEEKCNEERKAMLAEIIDCTQKKLSDGAVVYWSFNCDSSWLSLKNKQGSEHRLFTLDTDMLELTGRIGHVFFYEYDRTILFVNKVISGCCSPVDYYLYDKKEGTLLNYLGRAIFVSEEPKLPYFVSVTNSSYKESQEDNKVKTLSVFNLNTLNRQEIGLPKEVTEHILTTSVYPEELIRSKLINKHTLRVEIPYTVNDTTEAIYTQNIDLSRF
ncbi:MAG: hypothetical protein BGO31_13695 [Bacteroidetes bacterium 43-16]|nr:MAG: hypothetical protein BGO31_13695 [Bacteroidetes bacterium 43-16]